MSTDCLFCKIVSREIPAEVVLEDDDVLAFRDISPQAPTHVLIVPKVHAATVSDLAGHEQGERLFGRLLMAAAEIAKQEGLDGPGEGFRLVVNNGERSAQSVFHLHFHVMGGRMFGWPPG